MSPRPGQYRTGGTRDGLFDGDGQPTEIRTNPLTRECPRSRGGCGASKGQRCTTPSHGGPRELHGRYHDARKEPGDAAT